MAAGWFRGFTYSARGRSSDRSHSSFPVLRSKHCVNSFWFSKAVKNMWRLVSTGEDLPGRTAVLQMAFLSLPNSVGNPESFDTPEPLGPRKRVQSSGEPSDGSKNNAT